MFYQCCSRGKIRENVVRRGESRKMTLAVLILIAAIAGAVVSAFAFGGKNYFEASQAVQASGGVVKIPLAQVNDGAAHFFHYTAGGRDIRFFVLKSSDGVIRSSFDACDVCFREKKGYRQEGDFMICNNCGNRFPSTKINVLKGGCNPAPLEKAVSGSALIIKVLDILKGETYFS
jgi:uncharacterized membrane protein